MKSQENDENKPENFINEDNNKVFCKYWKPEGDAKALIVIVHGFGEHCGRYEPLAKMLTELGFLVFSQDHVGHGKSEGYKCDISDYNIYVRDIHKHIIIMQKKFPGLPLFLYGHSMGGALSILIACKYPELFRSVVLSSPMIKSEAFNSQIKVTIARFLSSYIPYLPVASLDASSISRDANEVEKYKNDPLVNHNKVTIRMGYQLFRMSEAVTALLPQVMFPFLVLHGDQDRLANIAGSKLLFQVAKSSDKTMKVYPDCYHELIHEIDNIPEKFLNDIKSWLLKQMP